MTKTERSALRKAVEKAGGVTQLGELCGVTRQTIHNWLNDGIPEMSQVLKVESVTGIPRQELKPDWFNTAA